MSKVKDASKKEVINEVPEEAKPSADSVLESLRAQSKEFNEKAEYFKTMSLKASGAIEILVQLHGEDGKS